MGTDIHSILEIHRPSGWERDADPAGWYAVDTALFRSPYFLKDEPISLYNAPYTSQPLKNRNYRLFAMLADVRNGRGFAGVDTGDRVEPIAEPRGVPLDASAEWRSEVADWESDMYSHSRFTLAELEAYDWDGLLFERGYVPEAVYLELRDSGRAPEGWSGGISGPGITTMTAAEYEALSPQGLQQVRDQFPTTDEKWFSRGIYVQHQWVETRRDNMGELAEVMEIMRNCAPYVAPRNTERDHAKIRICFGFDS